MLKIHNKLSIELKVLVFVLEIQISKCLKIQLWVLLGVVFTGVKLINSCITLLEVRRYLFEKQSL